MLYIFLQFLLIIPIQGKNPISVHRSLTLKTLLNCSYYVDDYFGNVKLKGGRYLKKDEGYECLVQLLAQTWGDINGDGQIDALVVLTGEACGGKRLRILSHTCS